MVTTQVELEVAPRQVQGKKVRHLRRQGVTPANIYGHGLASLAVQVPTAVLLQLLRRIDRSTIISLRVAGEDGPRPAFVHHRQRHPISDEILHVDFYQVSLAERIRLEVPIVVVGQAPAVDAYSGVLMQGLNTVLVEALPTEMPAHIEVDVSGLGEIDDALHLRDLRLPAGVVVHGDPETMVVKVAAPAVEREAAAEEAVAPAAEAPAAAEEEKG